jgi:hypothetical protein
MLRIKLSINQTGNGDPPPKKPPTDPQRAPAEPIDPADVDTTDSPKK